MQVVKRKEKALQSPWVLFWIGLFVVFVSANILMIYLAADRPGLVAENYYERGQDYENTMLKRQRMRPDWDMLIHPPQQILVNQPAVFEFSVADRAGTPVAVDGAVFRVYRPADARQDFELEMEAIGAGRYRARVTFPLPGVWDILVSTLVGEQEWNSSLQIFARKPNSETKQGG